MSTAAEPQFHVLAVDDSLTDRKLIERLLRISSCQVTTVDSGSKALEFLGLHEQEIEVNLIITDYCMPGMTGYDLLKRIKESESMKDIPVVIMSSEYTPSRINRCLEEGAEEFFMKPVQLSDMKKLRPYLLKGKSRDNKGDLATPSSQDRLTSDHAELVRSIANSMSSNKRKALDHEEQQSPDRRRARFSSTDNLTVV